MTGSGRRLVEDGPSVPYWQTTPCPAWCGYQHRDDDVLEDRGHLSDWVGRVRLALVDRERFLVEMGPRAVTDPDLNVQVLQGEREVEPRVQLGFGESRVTFHMTVGEALALADELVKAADLAEGHWGG